MRNRFIGIISLCMVFSLLSGCGSVQAKDSTVPLSYSEEAREIIPDCEFYVIKDGGHEFFGQPFEDAMSYILPYLEGQLSGENISGTSENEEGEGEEIDIEDLKFEDEPPMTALNLAQGNINVAEGEDFTAQLDFTVENGTIDGTVSADTITLKDAFEGLTIDSVSNDETTLTLNISGTPELGELYNVGTIELDGKYLGGEDAVSKSVVITQLQPVEMAEGGTFAFVRFLKEGRDAFGKDSDGSRAVVFVMNRSDKPVFVDVTERYGSYECKDSNDGGEIHPISEQFILGGILGGTRKIGIKPLGIAIVIF